MSIFRIDSFRNRLLVLFAGMSFMFGLCITLYIGKTASAQMSQTSGQTLYIAAKSISNTLANSLTEREREMVLLRQSPFFDEAEYMAYETRNSVNGRIKRINYREWEVKYVS